MFIQPFSTKIHPYTYFKLVNSKNQMTVKVRVKCEGSTYLANHFFTVVQFNPVKNCDNKDAGSGAMAHPAFGRSVNPIPTKGVDYAYLPLA